MSRTIRIREYHESNPKIDIFFNGQYRYSTNWFTRCSDAKAEFWRNATVAERLSPSHYLVALIDHSRDRKLTTGSNYRYKGRL